MAMLLDRALKIMKCAQMPSEDMEATVPTGQGYGEALSRPEEIINEARNGRMFIIVDDEDPGNEGDLVIPAQMATPDAINFMAIHARGLICLALTEARVRQLELGLMSPSNESRHQKAFTVSIEARHGVSTGISATDRARTIAVAIDHGQGPGAIVSPGHVFPLAARAGGVLARAGHTEAAVDVARLAGLNPSAVVCGIMDESGAMARLANLVMFARNHGLKIGTIRDLIAYRRRHDLDVVKTGETRFKSYFGGEWRIFSFRNKVDGHETIALLKGEVHPGRSTLVRMHQLDIFGDTLGEMSERSGLLQSAMREIEKAGDGVVVIINRFASDTFTRIVSAHSSPDDAANIASAQNLELRDYGLGAQVLAELGVHEMILLTNTSHSPIALAGYGLSIVGERFLPTFEY